MAESIIRGSILSDASSILQRFYLLSQLNMFDKYVIVFDKHLQIVDYHPACLSLLKNPNVSEDYLLGKHMLFLVPDFEETGILDKIFTLSHNGGSFCLDCYKNVSEVGRDLYVKVIIFRFNHLIYTLNIDITEDVQKQQLLQKQAERIRELERRCAELGVSRQLSTENSEEVQRNIYCNLNQLIFPLIDTLRNTKMDSRQLAVLDAIAESLHKMIEPFARSLNNKANFSQREIQIANLIQEGKTTKEISNILCLSCKTIDYYRANLRKKLGISNTKNDLRSSLLSLIEA